MPAFRYEGRVIARFQATAKGGLIKARIAEG